VCGREWGRLFPAAGWESAIWSRETLSDARISSGGNVGVGGGRGGTHGVLSFPIAFLCKRTSPPPRPPKEGSPGVSFFSSPPQGPRSPRDRSRPRRSRRRPPISPRESPLLLLLTPPFAPLDPSFPPIAHPSECSALLCPLAASMIPNPSDRHSYTHATYFYHIHIISTFFHVCGRLAGLTFFIHLMRAQT